MYLCRVEGLLCEHFPELLPPLPPLILVAQAYHLNSDCPNLHRKIDRVIVR